MMKIKPLFYTALIALLLQACSGNSFHLRDSVALPSSVQKAFVSNLAYSHGLVSALELAMEEAGGQLLRSDAAKPAPAEIAITNLNEGKHVVSYTDTRKAREYLVYLRFEYTVTLHGQEKPDVTRINLDRSFIYDADYALGKAEEEDKIREGLHSEAARLIMLKLKSLSL